MNGMKVGVDRGRTAERQNLLPKSTFKAYSAQQDSHGLTPSQLRALKISLVCSDCFLIGLQPILVHMSKNSDGKFSYSPVSVNFLTEVCKVIFATIVLLITGTGRPGPPMYKSIRSFVRDAVHNRLLMIPAGLYAVNNYLKFVMQLYFKPTTAKMLGNLKIFTIALLLRVVLNRKFSTIQWEALFLLVFGITINQLSVCQTGSVADSISSAAILYTLGSVTIPATASVYNELALKKHMRTSVHLQNFFLYFYGMVFNMLGLFLYLTLGSGPRMSMFSGFTSVTVLLVINNAAQGILSSFFFKFADTILKKYSSTLATIFTGIMSAIFFGHELTSNFLIGISIVFISMHQFFAYGEEKFSGGPKEPHVPSNGAPREARFIHSPSADHIKVFADDNSSPRSGSVLPR